MPKKLTKMDKNGQKWKKWKKTDGPWTPFWSKFVHFGFVIFLFFVVSPSTNQKLYRTGAKIEENNLNLDDQNLKNTKTLPKIA